MTTALADRNLSAFLQLIQEAGLEESLDSMSNMTLFAPTNDAIDSMPMEQLKELKGNPTKLRDLLMYHITGPEAQGCDMENNQLLKTGLMDKSVRVNLFATVSFFLCLRSHENSSYLSQSVNYIITGHSALSLNLEAE